MEFGEKRCSISNCMHDFLIATFVSKIFSQALLNKVQANLKAKLNQQFATSQFEKDLKAQMNKISAVELSLNSKPKEQPVKQAPVPATKANTPAPETKSTLPEMREKLKEVNESLAKETEAKNAALKEKNKPKAPIRDARKLLQVGTKNDHVFLSKNVNFIFVTGLQRDQKIGN